MHTGKKMRPPPTPRLDAKDRQVLHELDADSGRSLSEIGKKIKLNRDVMHYRVKRLENSKVIAGYKLEVDYGKLGYLLGGLRLTLKNDDAKTRKKMIDFYKNKKEVVFVFEMNGKIEMGFLGGNISEVRKKQKEFSGVFRRYFKEVEQIVYTGKWYFRIGKKKFVYGNEKIADEMDEKIIRLLLKNAKTPHKEISKMLGISAGQVNYRIKGMEKKKIILKTRALIDLDKMGVEKYRLKITLEDFSALGDVIDYLSENAVEGYDGIGLSDFECDIEVGGYSEMIELADGLKSRFSGKIRQVENCRYNYISNISK